MDNYQVVWEQTDEGWQAVDNEGILGEISFSGGSYETTGFDGTNIGTFSTLREAQTELEEWLKSKRSEAGYDF